MESVQVHLTSTRTVYEAFTPLALISKAGGLFPARNILKGPYSPREWISFWIIPTVLLLEHLLLYLDGPETIRRTYALFDTTSHYVGTLEFYNEIFSAILQFGFMQLYFSGACEVFDKLARFDVKLSSDVNVRLRRTAIRLSVLYVSYFAYCLVETYWLEETRVEWMFHVISFFHLLCNMLPLTPLLVVMFMSEAIRERLKEVTAELVKVTDHLPKNFVDENAKEESTVTREDVVDRLCHLCGAMDELTDILGDVSDTMGPSLALSIFSLLFGAVAYITLLLIDVEWLEAIATKVGIVIDVVICLFFLVITILVLSRISTEATKCMSNLQRVRITSLDPDIKELVLQMTDRLSSRSFTVTGAKLFAVDRNLLTAIAATATTYIIILAQFKQAEGEADNKNMGSEHKCCQPCQEF